MIYREITDVEAAIRGLSADHVVGTGPGVVELFNDGVAVKWTPTFCLHENPQLPAFWGVR